MNNSQLTEINKLMDQFIPSYRLRQLDRVRIKASPELAWPTIRALDVYEFPLSRALFMLRTLPELIGKRLHGQHLEISKHSTIEDFTGPTKGFKILAEEPGREIVIGSIGKFWKMNIPFIQITPETFASFNEPGYGKLAWSLRIDPDPLGGSWLSWQLRVTSTDDKSWIIFKRYWFVIGKFSHLIRKMALKHFQKQLSS